jgi:hypothetical protein
MNQQVECNFGFWKYCFLCGLIVFCTTTLNNKLETVSTQQTENLSAMVDLTKVIKERISPIDKPGPIRRILRDADGKELGQDTGLELALAAGAKIPPTELEVEIQRADLGNGKMIADLAMRCVLNAIDEPRDFFTKSFPDKMEKELKVIQEEGLSFRQSVERVRVVIRNEFGFTPIDKGKRNVELENWDHFNSLLLSHLDPKNTEEYLFCWKHILNGIRNVNELSSKP